LSAHTGGLRLLVQTVTFVFVTLIACLAASSADSAEETCAGLPATIEGTDETDQIRGTENDDVIVGLGGNDDIKGVAGNDIICGGSGADGIHGGGGKDLLFGDGDRDMLIGSAGRDRIHGGLGNDALFGSDGGDILLGEDDRDYLRGGDDQDLTLDGGAAGDAVYSDADGAAVVLGGPGRDICGGAAVERRQCERRPDPDRRCPPAFAMMIGVWGPQRLDVVEGETCKTIRGHVVKDSAIVEHDGDLHLQVKTRSGRVYLAEFMPRDVSRFRRPYDRSPTSRNPVLTLVGVHVRDCIHECHHEIHPVFYERIGHRRAHVSGPAFAGSPTSMQPPNSIPKGLNDRYCWLGDGTPCFAWDGTRSFA
jgi:RTX calcium-binding nonapeptide repeat (4 copies)